MQSGEKQDHDMHQKPVALERGHKGLYALGHP